MLCFNAWANQESNVFILVKAGCHIQWGVGVTESINDHRLKALTMGDVYFTVFFHLGCLTRRSIYSPIRLAGILKRLFR
jgi:hypothetical protein